MKQMQNRKKLLGAVLALVLIVGVGALLWSPGPEERFAIFRPLIKRVGKQVKPTNLSQALRERGLAVSALKAAVGVADVTVSEVPSAEPGSADGLSVDQRSIAPDFASDEPERVASN